jgi:hypothetical protein
MARRWDAKMRSYFFAVPKGIRERSVRSVSDAMRTNVARGPE